MQNFYFKQLPLNTKIYIASKLTKKDRNYLLLYGYEITEEMEQIAKKNIEEKYPISKIFKEKYFYNNYFYTDENTLDPRQDSEIMIEYLEKIYAKNSNFSFLDLGTGTGVLAITIANIFKNSSGLAIDISVLALETAKKNAKNIKSIEFKQNNWLQDINQNFDLLISNPPYLDLCEIKNELKYDPFISLYAGEDPLIYYKKISEKNFLFKHIILEINPKYHKEMQNLFNPCQLIKDYTGVFRFLYKCN